MLKVRNLKKTFNGEVVFSDVSFEIRRGTVTSIIGPSGMGKSTLLRCLNLLETPDEGIIEIDGKTIDLAHASKADTQYLRQNISMVFQTFNLFANKTAIQNIIEPLVQVKKIEPKVAEAKAIDLLKVVGLEHRKDAYPATLSGGEKQRVGIARAMGMDSKLILLDEPTSALDPSLVNEVLAVISKLASEDVTMLIVTHEMRFARNISDEVIFLADHKIVEKGSPEEIFDHPQDARTRQFIQALAKGE